MLYQGQGITRTRPGATLAAILAAIVAALMLYAAIFAACIGGN